MKTNIILVGIIAIVMLLPLSVAASADIPGDVNADGKITTADSLLALQMAVGSVAPDMERADMNADGEVNSLDALMILAMAEKTQVCVNAPEIVSGTFDVTIEIYNAADLDSGQFDLSFDPGVVRVTAVRDGDVGGRQVPVELWDFMSADTIRVLFNLPGVSGVSGTGQIATISFETTGSQSDTSVLDISNGRVFDTWAEEIPAIWIDCEVTAGEHTPPVNRVHNINTGEDFSFIQDAIDDPDTLDGHIIEVEDGVYHENVKVTKSLTIRSENGSANCVIQDAGRPWNVVEITVDHVSINGFTVKRSPESASGGAGIYLDASYCNVSSNNCSNNWNGIFLDDSSNNSISSNNCSNNWNGIFLDDSSNNSISSNNCSNRYTGIRLYGSSNNIISNNNCSNNVWAGIYLDDSSNNSISSNNCLNNRAGIFLDSSCNNIIYMNNFINNGDNIDSWSHTTTNIWNSTLKINYTYKGNAFTNYLGNHWDDYEGSDSDKDGIGDTPYGIDSDRDDYPLMKPFENYFAPTENRTQVCVNAPEVVSGTFDATIDIHNVSDLDSGQFDLTFDSSVVNVTAVHDGRIAGTQVLIDSWEFIDADTIRVLFNPQGITGVSGSGQIATISFEVTGSQGDMSVLDISNGTLTDMVADEMPAIWNDSAVTVGVPVTVSAPEVVSIVSGVFNATIEIEDVTDLHGGQFDLSFDPSVVNVIGVDAGNINGTTIPIIGWRFMDDGRIRVLFKLSDTNGVSGSGYVARIDFEITGLEYDTSALDLSEGLLADTMADEIPAIWIDDGVVIGVPVMVNASEKVSGTFNATIDIRNVTDMHAGQFDLSFDPGVVNVLGVDAGNIRGTTIPIIGWRFMNDGRIRVLFMLSGLDTVSGSGYVARIDFETTGSEGDACALDISNGQLVSITFNEWGMAMPEEIPAIWINDVVTIGEPAPTPPTQTSVHNIDTGENFSSVQAAIDDLDTLDGHTIEVEDGVHHENVDVTKSLTIRSENGSSSCIIQAARGNDHVVEITSDYASMSGFAVERASAMIKAGIYLNASHCSVSNNNCSRNHYGIYLENSTDNNVSDNSCFLNSYDGIYLEGSSNNTVSDNNCSSNRYWGLNLAHESDDNTVSDNDCSDNGEGVFISDSNNNTIFDNNCASNKYWGINLIHKSDNSIVFDNNCSNNREGIHISGSNSSISNNTCSSNDRDGIYISGRNNVISNNTCSNNSIGIRLRHLYDSIVSDNDCHLNGIGIHLSSSNNNTVSNNNCSSNTDYGIKLHKSGGNRIYLNNFINTRNVCSYESFNTWRSTSEITYIYNRISYTGYLGNYWSDYTGEDTDGDGIGDAPYIIDPDYWNEDDCPLMERFENYVISKPIYVSDTYSTIQHVVDNATKRAIITDRDGTYVENVEVNKRLTIRSENGSEETMVIAESSSENVFEMTADHTTINEFTVAVKHVSGKEVASYCGDTRDPDRPVVCDVKKWKKVVSLDDADIV